MIFVLKNNETYEYRISAIMNRLIMTPSDKQEPFLSTLRKSIFFVRLQKIMSVVIDVYKFGHEFIIIGIF